MKLRHLTVVVALAGAALVPAAPAHAIGGVVQPGDFIETKVGYCTLNFLFQTSAGKKYFATAAHCVEKVGEPIKDINGRTFGTVAMIGDADVTAQDYAFIEVGTGIAVSPAVKGWPQYPTGYTLSNQTQTGNQIRQSGYGLGFDLTSVTQEERWGYLTYDDPHIWEYAGAMNFGDSGGPLIHVSSGKALGIESRVCIGACTDEGPTIEGVLQKAGDRGLVLSIVTVGP